MVKLLKQILMKYFQFYSNILELKPHYRKFLQSVQEQKQHYLVSVNYKDNTVTSLEVTSILFKYFGVLFYCL